jgi:uncharacterized protein YcbX
MPTLRELFVYPIKGAAGWSPASAAVEERGLRHDRRFMVVEPDGTFVTQRQSPTLATIGATVVDDRTLVVRHPCGDVERCEATPTDGERMAVSVWEDEVEAIACSSRIDALLSDALGLACRIVFMPPDSSRLTAAKRGLPQRAFSFADAAPLLLLARSAVDDLNERLSAAGAAPVGADRFRANMLLDGVPLFADDAWMSLAIGQTRLRLATRCKRCEVVAIDQRSGVRCGAEPLRTLADYRREGDGIVFGRHALVDAPGLVRVGDEVSVLD